MNFSHANLRGVNLGGNSTKHACFYGADLSGAKKCSLSHALLDDATVLYLAIIDESDPEKIQSYLNRGALFTAGEKLNAGQKTHVICLPETH